MKNVIIILILVLWYTKGINQHQFNPINSSDRILTEIRLPNCVEIKPWKIHPKKYLLKLENNIYLYYGDYYSTSCLVYREIDSDGSQKQIPSNDLLSKMEKICNLRIIEMGQAKKIANSHWDNYKLHPSEIILKYETKLDHFYWELNGYTKFGDRTILIDAISGIFYESRDFHN